MSDPDSPLDELVDAVRSALHARRQAAFARSQRIKSLADAYLRSAEHALSLDFSIEHGLKRPEAGGRSPEEVARLLAHAVAALPELAEPEPKPKPKPKPEPEPHSAPPPPAPGAPTALPHLSAALAEGPVVIVGGLARLDKLARLPEHVRDQIEWIDTSRQGTHAIGNLDRRIRDGRLAALVVIEGRISHKHSDPLLSAARQRGCPVAYAGKGGQAALVHAFDELDAMLSRCHGLGRTR